MEGAGGRVWGRPHHCADQFSNSAAEWIVPWLQDPEQLRRPKPLVPALSDVARAEANLSLAAFPDEHGQGDDAQYGHDGDHGPIHSSPQRMRHRLGAGGREPWSSRWRTQFAF
jgi:hypothetical protein